MGESKHTPPHHIREGKYGNLVIEYDVTPHVAVPLATYKMRLSGQDRAKAGRERGAIPQVLAKAITDWAETHP